MVRSHEDPAREVDDELRAVRHHARQLLGQLRVDRARAEARWAELGRNDPIKSVTGRSAMDNAVRATEGMIHSLDRFAAEVAGADERQVSVTTKRLASPVAAPLGFAP